MNDTTRKYPRTLLEAFPRDARHAYPIEHYRSSPINVGDAIGLVIILAMSALIGAAWVL